MKKDINFVKEYHVSLRKKVESLMKFLNIAVNSGGVGLREYEIQMTDFHRVRDFKPKQNKYKS